MPTPPSQTPDVQYDADYLNHEHGADVFGDGANTPDATVKISTPSTAPLTRTVAIIKPHALKHRFDIERRIQEASFEIVKERQMEFDTETDPDTLYDLFGDDTDALAEGPVWVYVLERRRAVEVWNTLMGHPDVEIARRETPNSLRALYGISAQQNGLMGSPDAQTAEIQILSLFASSPPFPTSDLPAEEHEQYPSMRSDDSALLESIRRGLTIEDEGYAPSSVTNPSTAGGTGPRLNANGKVPFKARAVPATHDKPDIVPRMTRSAALRAGQPVEKPTSTGPRAPVSKERQAETFANVPGHKRTSTIQVASTAAPTIAPRMTRAASLRLGQPLPPPVTRQRSTGDEQAKANTFEGVPGHKRRESIAVASIKAPTVAPRLNKSASLRAQKEQTPPTSFMFRAGSAAKTPTLSRATSTQTLSSPSKAPPAPRPASQASNNPATSRYTVPRASSVASRPTAQPPKRAPSRSATAGSSSAVNGDGSTEEPAAAAAPAKAKPRPSSIAAPSIAPRTNKSAALRAAKKEAENAAALAAAAKKAAPRPSRVAPPPSSFKAIPT
ncbi:putative nucleoside diphosphate kinase 5 [Psilocybe cubensis]|uniref:Nucleoside diphosphate kinase 5 n=2 Tax=Psilocybe cubensis TaxID=181762 RepID=A0ACB8GZR3_PSICU|nr:putative nucleoside diphosphate kinase 5 [Psilocybe cubensis]KAH9480440.1 putative nucleoside diphosphate kinase 5 [Psilocybe cubensis]